MKSFRLIFLRRIKLLVVLLLTSVLIFTAGFYIFLVNEQDLTSQSSLNLENPTWKNIADIESQTSTNAWQTEMQNRAAAAISARRQSRIDKVEDYFRRYGSKLQGYGHIFVDQAEACGGDYRILVGIAGSESGLGRVMYKRYNPFGYLNRVQYNSQEEALTFLACQVSRQHIAPCGDDLFCLARRYGGPETDLNHFVNKVRWFARNVS